MTEETPSVAEQLKIVVDDPYLKPHAEHLLWRGKRREELIKQFTGSSGDLSTWANGHHYFGLHKEKDDWVFREWAPNASAMYLLGTFNDWQERHGFLMQKINGNGVWEIRLPHYAIKHGDLYKLRIYWPGGSGERIPSYAFYVVQDENSKMFNACIWDPPNPYKFKNPIPPRNAAPLIYEAHVGMAQIEGRVHTYDEFRQFTLPRIKKAGYNTIQMMAIQEHPYYGSFGYQVSSFFAPSSRFGTPNQLKELIDAAHGMGIRLIMDIVHSHAVKNQVEGLGLFDGTQYQYFHDGGRGLHPNWDTMCFDYGKG
ncbi:MAG: alpha-amylase family glycosyl hydrolase, partial [Pseudomonadota bacterium]